MFNPQTQFQVTWPAEPVVALAYVDQLRRSGDLAERLAEEFASALQDDDTRKLKRLVEMLEPIDGDDATAQRKAALADVLTEL